MTTPSTTPPDELTAEMIEELERLEKGATAAPWYARLWPSGGDYCTVTAPSWPVCTVHYDDDRRPCVSEDGPAACAEEDAILIASLRNAAPALIRSARLAAARGERIAELERSEQCNVALFGERKCECGSRQVACFGSYEMGPYQYACDECCAHGCEDGHCVPVAEKP
jgi:hypothetical protein